MKTNIFSKNCSIALKGVLCFLVLVHHLYRTGNPTLDSIFGIFGPLAVGGFFLLSGYGVVVNYKKFGKAYLKNLLFKKIPLTYLLIIITNAIYLALYALTVSSNLSFANVTTSIFYIFFAKSYLPVYSWIYFLFYLIIYYLILALIFLLVDTSKKIKNKAKIGSLIYASIALLIFLVTCFAFPGVSAQRAALCFSLGLIVSACEEEIKTIISKNKTLLVLIFSILLIMLFKWHEVEIVGEQIMPVIFCFLIVTAFSQVDIKSKFVICFGKISLYIYLTHGFFFKLFNSFWKFTYLQQFVLVTICSIIVSSLMYYLITKQKVCPK